MVKDKALGRLSILMT